VNVVASITAHVCVAEYYALVYQSINTYSSIDTVYFTALWSCLAGMKMHSHWAMHLTLPPTTVCNLLYCPVCLWQPSWATGHKATGHKLSKHHNSPIQTLNDFVDWQIGLWSQRYQLCINYSAFGLCQLQCCYRINHVKQSSTLS